MDISDVQRDLMCTLVEDDFFLSEVLATVRAHASPEQPLEEVNRQAVDVVRDLIEKDLVQLIYYYPPYKEHDREPLDSDKARDLLGDAAVWRPPPVGVDLAQVRIGATDLGRSLFF